MTLEGLLYGKYRLGLSKHQLRYRDMTDRTGKIKIYEQDYNLESKFTRASAPSLAVLVDPETDKARTAPVYKEGFQTVANH